MIIAVLEIDFYLHDSQSLKDKRTILRAIKDRIGKKFNVSIAEVDFQDKWQRSRIGIVQVGSDFKYLEKNINSIFNIIDSNTSGEIIKHSLEFI